MMDETNGSAGAEGAPVEPLEGAAPRDTASELFAHGLLAHLNAEHPAQTARRVTRAMHAIDREQAEARRFRLPAARPLAAAAALLLVAAVAAWFLTHTEPAAQALIRASIAALRTPGERRYEARRQRPEDEGFTLSTTIDSRHAGLILVRHRPPNAGTDLIAGRDAAGPWHLRHDGTISREGGLPGIPRWATIGGASDGVSLFADPLDVVLEALARTRTLERPEPGTVPGRGDRRFERLVARRTNAGGSDAGRIELWIDPATRVPERIEMTEFPPPGPAGTREPGVPPPPRSVIIDRVDADAFPEDWFAPERWAGR